MGRVGWIVDERFQNSCVGGCEISDCRVQLSVSFWVRQAGPKRDRLAGPKRDRLAALLLFPFRKAYWKHNGNKSVEGFAGPPGGPNLGTLWSILAPPFLPVSLRNPAPHVPHPLPDRYRSLRRPRQRLRSPPSSPHSPFPLPSTHLRTPSTPRSPPTTDPPCPTLSLPFLFVCNHIILRTHPCLYISQKYFPVTPYLAAVA